MMAVADVNVFHATCSPAEMHYMEHNLIDIPLDHHIQHNTIYDPRVNMTDSSCKLDTLQTYLEKASSQPQLKNGILCPQSQTLSPVNQ